MNKKVDETTELGRIIKLARGDRSLRQYAEDAGVNFTTVNRIEKGEQNPSLKMIQKLTSPEAKPQNGVTYEDVMSAAGFKTAKDEEAVTEAAHEIAEQIVGEKSEEPAKDKKEKLDVDAYLDTKPMSYVDLRRRRIQLLSMAKGLVFNAVNERGMVFTNIQDEIRPWRNESELKLAVDKGSIKIWHFDFRSITPDDRYYRTSDSMVFGQLFRDDVDESIKHSLVTNNPYFFDRIASRHHRIPYRGELSIILVDLDNMIIEKEVYLSNYKLDDYSEEFYLV